MNFSFGIFLLSIAFAIAAHDAPPPIGAKNNDDLDFEELAASAPFEVAGEMLLLEWLPFPINKYKYMVLNASTWFSIEEGVASIEQFSQDKYPDVKVALAVVPGDGEFIYLEKIPVISVDAFKNDRYFQDYQDIIFTIHEFSYKVELWAHFLQYQDAFWPVRDRLTTTFQDFLDNPDKGNDDQPPKAVQDKPPVANFVEKPTVEKPTVEKPKPKKQ